MSADLNLVFACVCVPSHDTKYEDPFAPSLPTALTMGLCVATVFKGMQWPRNDPW